MKRFFYHGTSADNLDSILKNGILRYAEKLWTCSYNEIYLWDSEKLAECNCQEDEDEKYKLEAAFNMASESGQIACAKAKDCRVVIIKILLDEDEVEKDTSCENMENSGAVVIGRDISIDEIEEIHVSNDLSLLRGYFINFIIDRDYCNIEFNKIEQQIAKAMSKAEIYPEDIEEIVEFEKIELLQEIN